MKRHGIISAAVIAFCLCAVAAEAAEYPYLLDPDTDSVILRWFSEALLPSEAICGDGRDTRTFNSDTAAAERRITIDGLTPGKQYYYRVKNIGGWSALYSFKTIPERSKGLRFVIYGDSRDNPEIVKKISSMIKKEKPGFIVHNGDIAEKGKYSEFLDNFINPSGDLFSGIPLCLCPGNHDYSGWGANKSGRDYNRLFSGGTDFAYRYFEASGVLFVFLDTNSDLFQASSQYKWLEKVLAGSAARYKLVFTHHDPYTSGSHAGDAYILKLRRELCPLLEKYKVNAVFSGHDHNYERAGPVNGVLYIVTGGAGAPLRGKKSENSWSRTFFSAYHYIVADYDRKSGFKIQAKDLSGAVIDSFSLE